MSSMKFLTKCGKAALCESQNIELDQKKNSHGVKFEDLCLRVTLSWQTEAASTRDMIFMTLLPKQGCFLVTCQHPLTYSALIRNLDKSRLWYYEKCFRSLNNPCIQATRRSKAESPHSYVKCLQLRIQQFSSYISTSVYFSDFKAVLYSLMRYLSLWPTSVFTFIVNSPFILCHLGCLSSCKNIKSLFCKSLIP